MNDHVMPGDVTFTVRRYSCARVACGDDLIIYDEGNFVLMFNSLVYINVTQ